MPDPAVLHNKIDSSTFRYDGNTLVELEPDLWDIMCIGSDRDSAIDKAFKQAFSIAKILACKKHVEDYVRRSCEI